MIRVLGISSVISLVVGVALYAVLHHAMNETAALALELRASGEAVHATVVNREHRETRSRRNGRSHTEHHYELALAGALASGRPWTGTLSVDAGRYEASAIGIPVEVVVLSSDPGRFMEAANLASRNASGHQEGEGLMVAGTSGVASLVAGGVALLVQLRRRRR